MDGSTPPPSSPSSKEKKLVIRCAGSMTHIYTADCDDHLSAAVGVDFGAAGIAGRSASLSTLPVEIIYKINGYIPEQDWATRDAFARTSRRFHYYLYFSLYSSAVTT